MADINTLLGLGLGPNADMQALADNLRGQQREGRFLGMSTLAPVSAYGQNLQKGAVDAATRGGALRQSLAKDRQTQDNYNATALAKTAAAELANKNKVSADELAHTRRKEIAQMGLDAKANSTKLKPTGKATENYLKSKQLIGQIGDVQGLESNLNEDQMGQLDQPIADTLSTMFLPDSLERLAQEKLIYTDPDVKQYREKVADIESEFSKLMSGLAVSGFEMKDRKKWSPYAEGVSQETRARRLRNLDKKLKDQVILKEQIYDFGSGGGGSNFGSGGEEIIEEIIPQGSRSNDANYEEEREHNGITYGRIGDKWYEL